MLQLSWMLYKVQAMDVNKLCKYFLENSYHKDGCSNKKNGYSKRD